MTLFNELPGEDFYAYATMSDEELLETMKNLASNWMGSGIPEKLSDEQNDLMKRIWYVSGLISGRFENHLEEGE